MSNPIKPGPTSWHPNVVEVAARLGVDRSTLTRWITRGVGTSRRLGSQSKKVRLEATRLPGGWVVTDDALERFQADLTAAWLVPTVAETLETSGERSRRIERELKLLDELGLR